MTSNRGSTVTLVVGTKKGLFLARSTRARDKWEVEGPFLNGAEINHAVLDRRTGSLYATVNDPWFGPRISMSADMGKTWKDNKASPRVAEGSPLKAVAR
jgi:hypothetical protein